MPALPPVPAVLKTQIQWTVGSDALVDTNLYFSYSGGAPTSTDCVSLAASIYGLWAAAHTWWADANFLIGVKVTDLSSPSGGVGEHAQSTQGALGAALSPANIATLVNYVISRRYRGGKPRSYLPWGSINQLQTEQQWTASYISSADSALSTIFTGTTGLSSGATTISNHVNVSYYSGFTVVTNPITHRSRNVPTVRTSPVVDTILSYSVSPYLGSVRRRIRA